MPASAIGQSDVLAVALDSSMARLGPNGLRVSLTIHIRVPRRCTVHGYLPHLSRFISIFLYLLRLPLMCPVPGPARDPAGTAHTHPTSARAARLSSSTAGRDHQPRGARAGSSSTQRRKPHRQISIRVLSELRLVRTFVPFAALPPFPRVMTSCEFGHEILTVCVQCQSSDAAAPRKC